MTSPRQERKGALASRPALARLVALKRLLARLVLVSEQVLPMSLPLLSTVALYLAASWFGLFRLAPNGLRLAMLGAFVVAFCCLYSPSDGCAGRRSPRPTGCLKRATACHISLSPYRRMSPPTRRPLPRHYGANTKPAWRSGSRPSMPGCRVPISPTTTASRFAPSRRFCWWSPSVFRHRTTAARFVMPSIAPPRLPALPISGSTPG